MKKTNECSFETPKLDRPKYWRILVGVQCIQQHLREVPENVLEKCVGLAVRLLLTFRVVSSLLLTHKDVNHGIRII